MSLLLCLPISHVSRDHSVSSQLTVFGLLLSVLPPVRLTLTDVYHYAFSLLCPLKNPPTSHSEVLCVTMVL